MRVAIVHYHFKPGGVTRVVENACDALKSYDITTATFSGEAYTGSSLKNAHTLEGLGYASTQDALSPQALAQALKDEARQALGGAPDLWHIHNHSLGKNPAFSQMIHLLAQEGQALLLQLHDFAEDGRPANYHLLRDSQSLNTLYPIAPHVHYAVLNGRDYRLMGEAGISENNLHLLPNSITLPDISQEKVSTPTNPLVLYPTRGIRRKNIGELILWSALDPEHRTFATTATPANPAHLPVHERWESFAQKHKLRVTLGLCDRHGQDFGQALQSAQSLITTSIAEGFGLAFLEPWLLDKPLIGRDIPDITEDFKANAIALDHLYSRLRVPVETLGEAALHGRLSASLRDYYEAYAQPLPNDALEEAWHALCRHGKVEFGSIDEPLQERVIQTLITSPELKAQFTPNFLKRVTAEQISHNRKQIEAHYNQTRYGERLQELYHDILNSGSQSASDFLPAESVLKAFLKPSRFNMLRT